MKPVGFPQANTTFGPLAGMQDKVIEIPAFIGTMYEDMPCVVRCHELDDAELLRVIETKRVYLSTLGTGRQPVMLTADNPMEKGWAR